MRRSICDQLEAARIARESTRDRLTTATLARLDEPDGETFQADVCFALDVLPALTARADQIKQLRQTILDLAVHGRLARQDKNDEPVAELLKRIASNRQSSQQKQYAQQLCTVTDPGDTPHLPKHWALVPLGHLVNILNGRAYKQTELLRSGTPVLRVGNLFTSNKWYYSDLVLDADKYCEKGDLIYAWSASFGPFIWAGDKVIFHYHIWKLSLYSEADLDKRYLYHFLAYKTREIKAGGHGISMVHMTKEKMERLQVFLPPLNEQRRIVAKLDELFAFCDRLEASLTTIVEIRRSLFDALRNEVMSSVSESVLEPA